MNILKCLAILRGRTLQLGVPLRVAFQKIRLLLAITLLLAYVSGCATVGAKDPFKLTVLHTNDVHSRLLPINSWDQTCSREELKSDKCFGGAARRSHMINEIRKRKENVILVDAGDQFQGTLFYTKNRGDEAKVIMNELRYDAMAIGNHEFDDGPKNLERFIEGVEFPVLSANIDASAEESLEGMIEPFTVLNVHGQKVGVIGCTTQTTRNISSPGKSIRFLSPEVSVQKAVNQLQAKGVNKIVLLSHAGFHKDIEIAKSVSGLDLIVAGHTNTFLSNSDRSAEGSYPSVVQSPENKPVLIVSAYAYGKYLGDIDIVFDRFGNIKSWKGDPILLDNTVPLDPKVQQIVQNFEDPLIKMRKEVVGYLPVELKGGSVSCRRGECLLGDVMADAILDIAKPYGADLAVMNGGGLRTGISKGPVTRWQVMDAVPFENEIVIFKMTGKEVWETIDGCLKGVPVGMDFGAACFPQVSGMTYTWTMRTKYHASLVSIKVRQKNGELKPISFKKKYTVATNRFLLIGGDGYQWFLKYLTKATILSETLSEAFIAYLSSKSHDKYQNLGERIKRL